MKLAVYLGSTPGSEPGFMNLAEDVGRWIGSHGHTLVYGGSDRGMMGALAKGVHETAGKIIGVMPSFMMDNGWDEKDLDQMIVTEDMAERRVRMMELSDGYLALPGGVGTLDEISEVMSSRKLGLVTGEIALMNYHGFYDSFLKYLDQMVQEGFYPETFRQLIHAPQNVRDLDKIFPCM